MFLRSEIYVMFSLLLLLTLSLRAQKSHVWAKRYELKPGWAANNTWPPYLPISGSEGTYKPLFLDYGTKNQTVISSDNGMFCLAMYVFKNSSEAYYLTIVMGCNVTGAGIPVWIANRNDPCPSSYVLRFSRSYSSYLLYDDQNTNWASPGSLGSAELQDSGNWVLYDNSTLGVVKWQSFDHPNDVLLPGQNLKESLMLYSRANSSTVYTGSFSASVEQNRFVLYLNISNNPQPYYRSASSFCPSSDAYAVVVYKDRSIELSYGNCSLVEIKKFNLPEDTASDGMNFLRLEEDGDIVSYSFDSSSSLWKPAKFFDNKCNLPTSCDTYGFCREEKCQCLSTKNVTVEDNSLRASSSEKCNEIKVENAPCNQNLERNNHFVQLEDYTYFSTDYINGIKGMSEGSCRESCLSNCSCSAFVYGNKECFLIDQVLGSFKSSAKMQSYLKFRNEDILSGQLELHSNKGYVRGLIAGVVLCVVVIVCLALVIAKLVRNNKLQHPKLLFQSVSSWKLTN